MLTLNVFGFKIDDAKLKRAGMDYWYHLDIHYYENIDEFFEKNEGAFFFFTTKGRHTHSDAVYPDNCYLLFGKETKGLPEDFLAEHYDDCVRIPMRAEARSLNLSNSVAVVLYEALRQADFPGLTSEGALTGREEADAPWLDYV